MPPPGMIPPNQQGMPPPGMIPPNQQGMIPPNQQEIPPLSIFKGQLIGPVGLPINTGPDIMPMVGENIPKKHNVPQLNQIYLPPEVHKMLSVELANVRNKKNSILISTKMVAFFVWKTRNSPWLSTCKP